MPKNPPDQWCEGNVCTADLEEGTADCWQVLLSVSSFLGLWALSAHCSLISLAGNDVCYLDTILFAPTSCRI